VVLSTGMHYDQGDTDWLEQKGVKVVTLDPQTLDEVLECVSLLGKITGREAESGNLVQDMESRIDYVADMTSGLEDSQKPSVLHVTWHDPLWTVGQGSYIDALIELAGGVNVFSDEEGDIMVDLEAALVADPEVITVFTGHGDAAGTSYEYVISGDSPFKNTQAYINDRIHLVDADIGSRGGPRLVDALEWYAWFIHPELFSEP
jgi:iron complex transport system substrate-binding protein